MQAVYAQGLQRQRALRCCVCLVLGRLYNQMKLARGRPPKDEKVENFSTFSGSAATSKYVASLHGVSEKTVRNAAEFAEVVIPSVPPPLAPNQPSTEKAEKFSAFSGRSATARRLGRPDARTRAPAIVALWGQIVPRDGVSCDFAAAERYNGSVCCAAAYALSCPLRSLRLCCSRVLTPRSQSSITDVS
jgi:hypothetical protein